MIGDLRALSEGQPPTCWPQLSGVGYIGSVARREAERCPSSPLMACRSPRQAHHHQHESIRLKDALKRTIAEVRKLEGRVETLEAEKCSTLDKKISVLHDSFAKLTSRQLMGCSGGGFGSTSIHRLSSSSSIAAATTSASAVAAKAV